MTRRFTNANQVPKRSSPVCHSFQLSVNCMSTPLWFRTVWIWDIKYHTFPRAQEQVSERVSELSSEWAQWSARAKRGKAKQANEWALWGNEQVAQCLQYIYCKNDQTGGKHIFITNYMIIMILHIQTCSNLIYCPQHFGCYGNNLHLDPPSNGQTSNILTKLSIIKLFKIKFWATFYLRISF